LTPGKVVRIELHPLHLQVQANLALLQAGEPADETTKKAIAVLRQINEQLSAIGCGGMGVDVNFE
jgi:hypothetical protein